MAEIQNRAKLPRRGVDDGRVKPESGERESDDDAVETEVDMMADFDNSFFEAIDFRRGPTVLSISSSR